MSQPYLDSAGNVNTAVASDLQNMTFAFRQQAAIPGGVVPATVPAAAAVVVADAITGLTSSAVTDV